MLHGHHHLPFEPLHLLNHSPEDRLWALDLSQFLLQEVQALSLVALMVLIKF
jgi:hypothetical protein